MTALRWSSPCGRLTIVPGRQHTRSHEERFDVLLDGRITRDGSGLSWHLAKAHADWIREVLGIGDAPHPAVQARRDLADLLTLHEAGLGWVGERAS